MFIFIHGGAGYLPDDKKEKIQKLFMKVIHSLEGLSDPEEIITHLHHHISSSKYLNCGIRGAPKNKAGYKEIDISYYNSAKNIYLTRSGLTQDILLTELGELEVPALSIPTELNFSKDEEQGVTDTIGILVTDYNTYISVAQSGGYKNKAVGRVSVAGCPHMGLTFSENRLFYCTGDGDSLIRNCVLPRLLYSEHASINQIHQRAGHVLGNIDAAVIVIDFNDSLVNISINNNSEALIFATALLEDDKVTYYSSRVLSQMSKVIQCRKSINQLVYFTSDSLFIRVAKLTKKVS